MRKKSMIGIVVCALALCLAIAGCTKGSDTSSNGDGNRQVELNIVKNTSNTTTVFTLDPAVQYQGSTGLALGVCETLFELNEDESDVNGILATDYTMSDDGLTWTINIREGIAFTSGRSLDAQVVKESLEYELASLKRLSTMLNLEHIGAEGKTLTITTKTIVPTLPKILTDSNLLIFDTNETADLSKNIVGTGAYVIKSVDGDGNCDLVRNDDYWRGKPIAQAVHSKCGLDATAVANALQSGEIDWGDIQSTNTGLFQDNSAYQDYTSLSNGRVYYLYLNPNYTFTTDPAVRQAIMRMVDRDSIVSGLYNSSGTSAYSIFPDYSPYYDNSNDQPQRNIEEAKKILAEAGYADTDHDGILEKDGKKVTVNITCYTANQFPALSEALQSELKEIGIEGEIVVSDAIMDDLGAGKFNIATYGYNTLTYGDPLNYLEPVFKTGGNSNFNGFSDPEVDKLLTQLSSATKLEERVSVTSQIQKRILQSDKHVFIMRPESHTIVRSSITTTEPLFGTNKSTGLYLWTIGKNE